MKLLTVGLSHHTAPLDVRERVAVDDVEPVLRKLIDADEIDEVVLLSTCNRTELVAVTRAVDAARLRLRSLLQREIGAGAAGPRVAEEHLFEHRDGEAIHHLLRVASSLDSLVVGEPQILGQTKAAYASAVDCGSCGPILSRLFQGAFSAAKRVRTETRIAERPVSVARVAVDLARQIFEDLASKQAVLIGAGDMVEMALHSLRGEGLASVCVANRTVERAERLAAEFGASAHSLAELPSLLARADVVLTSVGGDEPVIRVETAAPVLEQRRDRPLFVIDLGVPRNVDPALRELDNVYVYDMDDLGEVASDNAELREREGRRAESVVDEELKRLEGWLAALRAVPTIKHLRGRAESIRQREVERSLARSGLGEEHREALEALTRAIVNKLLHPPIARLRREAESEEGMAYLEAARTLFALDDGPDDADEDERSRSARDTRDESGSPEPD